MESGIVFETGDDYAQLKIFQGLSAEQFNSINPLFCRMRNFAGDMLFGQGDDATHLYLLIEGEIDICYKPEDGPPLTITRVKKGGVVGWSAALGSPSYTSSAICKANCRMLCISGEDLRHLYEENRELGELILERLADIIAERLRNTHEQVFALLEHGLRLSVHHNTEV